MKQSRPIKQCQPMWLYKTKSSQRQSFQIPQNLRSKCRLGRTKSHPLSNLNRRCIQGTRATITIQPRAKTSHLSAYPSKSSRLWGRYRERIREMQATVATASANRVRASPAVAMVMAPRLRPSAEAQEVVLCLQ